MCVPVCVCVRKCVCVCLAPRDSIAIFKKLTLIIESEMFLKCLKKFLKCF